MFARPGGEHICSRALGRKHVFARESVNICSHTCANICSRSRKRKHVFAPWVRQLMFARSEAQTCSRSPARKHNFQPQRANMFRPKCANTCFRSRERKHVCAQSAPTYVRALRCANMFPPLCAHICSRALRRKHVCTPGAKRHVCASRTGRHVRATRARTHVRALRSANMFSQPHENIMFAHCVNIMCLPPRVKTCSRSRERTHDVRALREHYVFARFGKHVRARRSANICARKESKNMFLAKILKGGSKTPLRPLNNPPTGLGGGGGAGFFGQCIIISLINI